MMSIRGLASWIICMLIASTGLIQNEPAVWAPFIAASFVILAMKP